MLDLAGGADDGALAIALHHVRIAAERGDQSARHREAERLQVLHEGRDLLDVAAGEGVLDRPRASPPRRSGTSAGGPPSWKISSTVTRRLRMSTSGMGETSKAGRDGLRGPARPYGFRLPDAARRHGRGRAPEIFGAARRPPPGRRRSRAPRAARRRASPAGRRDRCRAGDRAPARAGPPGWPGRSTALAIIVAAASALAAVAASTVTASAMPSEKLRPRQP